MRGTTDKHTLATGGGDWAHGEGGAECGVARVLQGPGNEVISDLALHGARLPSTQALAPIAAHVLEVARDGEVQGRALCEGGCKYMYVDEYEWMGGCSCVDECVLMWACVLRRALHGARLPCTQALASISAHVLGVARDGDVQGRALVLCVCVCVCVFFFFFFWGGGGGFFFFKKKKWRKVYKTD